MKAPSRFRPASQLGAALFSLVVASGCASVAGFDDLSDAPPPNPGSGAGGGGGGGSFACTSSLECTERNGGLPMACVDEQCVSYLSVGCNVVTGDLASERPRVGVVTPFPNASVIATVQLWESQLVAATGSAPVFVLCDDSTPSGETLPHLEALKVEVIVSTVELAWWDAPRGGRSTTSIPVFDLGRAPAPPAWALGAGALEEAQAVAAAVPEVLALSGAGVPSRVTVVVPPSAAAERVAFEDSVRFNVGEVGAGTVAENEVAGTYAAVIVDDEPAATASAVAASSPDLVVFLGRARTDELVALVEGQGATPRYLWGRGALEVSAPTLAAGRGFAALPAPGPDGRFEAFAIQHLSEHPDLEVTAALGWLYDGLALATFALWANADVEAGLPRLLGPGATTGNGPAELPGAMSALAAGGTLDFEGTMSSYDVDLGARANRHPFTFACGVGAGGPLLSDWRFDPVSGELTGAWGPCAP